jgi:hypothetical protein
MILAWSVGYPGATWNMNRDLRLMTIGLAWLCLLSCGRASSATMLRSDAAVSVDTQRFDPDGSHPDQPDPFDLGALDAAVANHAAPSLLDSSAEGSVSTSERKRIFHYPNGSLGQIPDATDQRPAVEVADELCMQGAASRKLGGSWKAWLSTSMVDAIDRIEDVGPWYRLDRETKLFENKSQLSAGPFASIAPPGDVRAGSPFWTGTLLDGTKSPFNCMDWRRYWEGTATVGRADAVGAAWVSPEPHSCNYYGSLLCIEQ